MSESVRNAVIGIWRAWIRARNAGSLVAPSSIPMKTIRCVVGMRYTTGGSGPTSWTGRTGGGGGAVRSGGRELPGSPLGCSLGCPLGLLGWMPEGAGAVEADVAVDVGVGRPDLELACVEPGVPHPATSAASTTVTATVNGARPRCDTIPPPTGPRGPVRLQDARQASSVAVNG